MEIPAILDLVGQQLYTNAIEELHRRNENKQWPVIEEAMLHSIMLQSGEAGKALDGMERLHKRVGVRPDLWQMYLNMGVAYCQMWHGDKAEAMIKLGMKHASCHGGSGRDIATGYMNLGVVYRNRGDVARAISAYRNALSIDERPRARSNLVYAHLYDSCNGANYKREAKLWAQKYETPSPSEPTGKVERVGFVSGDFRQHSVSQFLLPWIRYLAQQVDVYLYSTGGVIDEITHRLIDSVGGDQHWRSATRKAIEDDAPDVLVDLGGHSAGGNLILFAQRSAPVQIAYLGYPASTYLENIDEWVVPGGCTENVHKITIDAPHWCWEPTNYTTPNKSDHEFTFGSRAQPVKVSPETLVLWSQVMRACPDALFVYNAPAMVDPGTVAYMTQRMEMVRMPMDRVEFRSGAPDWVGYWQGYSDIDCMLDTMPYTGTTIVCDGLACGVPTLTMDGESHRERVTADIMRDIGLSVYIANSRRDFIECAKQECAPDCIDQRNTVSKAVLLLSNGVRYATAFHKMLRNACVPNRDGAGWW